MSMATAMNDHRVQYAVTSYVHMCDCDSAPEHDTCTRVTTPAPTSTNLPHHVDTDSLIVRNNTPLINASATPYHDDDAIRDTYADPIAPADAREIHAKPLSRVHQIQQLHNTFNPNASMHSIIREALHQWYKRHHNVVDVNGTHSEDDRHENHCHSHRRPHHKLNIRLHTEPVVHVPPDTATNDAPVAAAATHTNTTTSLCTTLVGTPPTCNTLVEGDDKDGGQNNDTMRTFTYQCSVQRGNGNALCKRCCVSSKTGVDETCHHHHRRRRHPHQPPTRPRATVFYGNCFLCSGEHHSQHYCPLRQCSMCHQYGHSNKVCTRSVQTHAHNGHVATRVA